MDAKPFITQNPTLTFNPYSKISGYPCEDQEIKNVLSSCFLVIGRTYPSLQMLDSPTNTTNSPIAFPGKNSKCERTAFEPLCGRQMSQSIWQLLNESRCDYLESIFRKKLLRASSYNPFWIKDKNRTLVVLLRCMVGDKHLVFKGWNKAQQE